MVNMVFPTPTNVTTFPEQLAYFNSLTDVGFGGILGIVLLLLFTLIMFLMTKAFSIGKAAGVSFVIGAIFAMFLWAMELINSKILTISIIFAVFGIYLLIKESSKFD